MQSNKSSQLLFGEDGLARLPPLVMTPLDPAQHSHLHHHHVIHTDSCFQVYTRCLSHLRDRHGNWDLSWQDALHQSVH